MNQDNQKPDYSFIMNQPGPELGPAKRSKKPIVLLGSVMFAFVVLGVVLFLFQIQPQRAGKYNDVTSQHLSLVANTKYEESRQLFKDQSTVSSGNYLLVWRDFMPKNFKLNECKIDGVTNGTGTVNVLVACPRSNSTAIAKFKYEYAQGSSQINKIEAQ